MSYADMIQIGELLQHIMRMDGDGLLSKEGRSKFAHAQVMLEDVKSEYERRMHEVTDFDNSEFRLLESTIKALTGDPQKSKKELMEGLAEVKNETKC